MSLWKSIKDHKPTEEGIYAVAVFDGDKMVEFWHDWAKCEGYFGPNKLPYFGRKDITHWMTQAEYYEALAAIPKE